jgi:hypothetical protein
MAAPFVARPPRGAFPHHPSVALMTWFKVDDSFHSHPKVLAASPASLGLWVVAGSWSGSNLSDGFVPDHVLPRLLPDAASLARDLVTAGLWKRARGGYRFHDWADFNPQRDAVEQDRKAARERMRKLRSGMKPAAQTPNRSPEQQANVRELFATPTRPDPILGGALGDPPTPPASDPGSDPPPLRCEQHIKTLDPPPCRACRTAREGREQWDREHVAAAAVAQSTSARERAETGRAAINACDQCDSTGYLRGGLCHHDPANVDRVNRGIAAARSAIRQFDVKPAEES